MKGKVHYFDIVPVSHTKCYGGAFHLNPNRELTQPWCKPSSCDDPIRHAALVFVRLFNSSMYVILQASLAINPAALLPGAAPPVKEEKPVAVGFDQPVEATTLHTAQKVRVHFNRTTIRKIVLSSYKSAHATSNIILYQLVFCPEFCSAMLTTFIFVQYP